MKNYKIYRFFYLFLLCILVVSCSSDDDVDMQDTLIYVNPKQGNSQVALNISYTQIKESNLNYILLPVKATGRVTKDTKVSLAVDESLVESYNNAKETNYVLLPSSAYSIAKSDINLASGSNISADSIQIIFDKNYIESNFNQFITATYILPIKISSVQTADQAVKVSTNLNVFYVIVDLSLTGFVAETSVKPGNSIDRSAWTAESKHSYSYGSAQSSYDNDLATSWVIQSSGGAHGIYYDLQNVHKLKGFSLVSSYTLYNYYNCVMGGFSVGISTDGAKWTDLGSVETTVVDGKTVDGIYQFAGVLDARYVRILPNKFLNSYNLASIAEIYFYE
ncbi:DUF1735 domain-containing protein [Dysgonomonas sp. Marseille-P4677]|uniref:BT_3987 domain-containing protein n=1 Tax=Dysgonomonas sp. Marseille-P4677 TaxID=2364790 RepID=UPI001913F090|nr:DUF1735 domain-containing protein [Dysgonomonas sp. Marseille-P4677]MBK5722744.1 DUF1735 domain-containing protein [Dysgonomonas sp. Marseille-P4677]